MRRDRGGGGRRGRPRSCVLCGMDAKSVDYKNVELIEQHVIKSAIRSRRMTRTCARHQRMITRAVKRARHVALLPFTPVQHRARRG